jgi:dipeptidyl-peptidase-4
MRRTKIICLLTILFAILFRISLLAGQDKPSDPSLLNLDRIFGSREFASERFGPARWMKDGASYTVLEDSAAVKGGRDIVLYSAETGRRDILVSASSLVPANASSPLSIDNYEWSADGKKLLVFTNSRRVWRQNTRGDYWVLDLAGGTLIKLGKGFEPSTLMFAKFSPDGWRAAYVSKNDIYAEDVSTGRIIRLTWDGSATLINGTADWVYEEEFSIRDGFRWSPDGQSIAFSHQQHRFPLSAHHSHQIPQAGRNQFRLSHRRCELVRRSGEAVEDSGRCQE